MANLSKVSTADLLAALKARTAKLDVLHSEQDAGEMAQVLEVLGEVLYEHCEAANGTEHEDCFSEATNNVDEAAEILRRIEAAPLDAAA